MIIRVAACDNLNDLEKKAKKEKTLIFTKVISPKNKIKSDLDDFPSRDSTPAPLSPRGQTLKANG